MPGARMDARSSAHCPMRERVLSVREGVRCSNGCPTPEIRCPVQRVETLRFPPGAMESAERMILGEHVVFWFRKTIFWHKFAVVNDSASSVDFRKMHNPRSQNFQDAESPSWGIHYRSQPQICARKRKIGTKRALSAANGDWVRWSVRCFGKARCVENGAIMSDD